MRSGIRLFREGDVSFLISMGFVTAFGHVSLPKVLEQLNFAGLVPLWDIGTWMPYEKSGGDEAKETRMDRVRLRGRKLESLPRPKVDESDARCRH